jgi:hypothetical protein
LLFKKKKDKSYIQKERETKLQVRRLLFCAGISVNKYGLHAHVIGLKTILRE